MKYGAPIKATTIPAGTPSGRISERKQPSAEQKGNRQEELMPWSNERAGDMWRHQTDEGNPTRDGDGSSGKCDGCQQELDPFFFKRDANTDRDRFIQGKEIEFIRLIERQRNQDE